MPPHPPQSFPAACRLGLTAASRSGVSCRGVRLVPQRAAHQALNAHGCCLLKGCRAEGRAAACQMASFPGWPQRLLSCQAAVARAVQAPPCGKHGSKQLHQHFGAPTRVEAQVESRHQGWAAASRLAAGEGGNLCQVRGLKALLPGAEEGCRLEDWLGSCSTLACPGQGVQQRMGECFLPSPCSPQTPPCPPAGSPSQSAEGGWQQRTKACQVGQSGGAAATGKQSRHAVQGLASAAGIPVSTSSLLIGEFSAHQTELSCHPAVAAGPPRKPRLPQQNPWPHRHIIGALTAAHYCTHARCTCYTGIVTRAQAVPHQCRLQVERRACNTENVKLMRDVSAGLSRRPLFLPISGAPRAHGLMGYRMG